MKTNRRLRLNIEGKEVPATNHVKLLRIEIDSKLAFIKPDEALCHKRKKKITTFSGLANLIFVQQAEAIIYYLLVLLNFNHCPLIWMFCNKGANKKLSNLINVLSRSYGEPQVSRQKFMKHHNKSFMNHYSKRFVQNHHKKNL